MVTDQGFGLGAWVRDISVGLKFPKSREFVLLGNCQQFILSTMVNHQTAKKNS